MDIINNTDAIYIKYIPKYRLLYHLWLNAKPAPCFRTATLIPPCLTEKKAIRDINYMIDNGDRLDINEYYGRMLYIDITGDYMDKLLYDIYNGHGTAKKIIDQLKLDELCTSITKYYLFY